MGRKDYGGAFDIDPYCFWTKEDLDELQSAIEDLGGNDFTITAMYLNDDKHFDIEYTDKWENEWHLEETISIDRRKASTTKELCEKYAPVIKDAIENEIRYNKEVFELEDYEDIMQEVL